MLTFKKGSYNLRELTVLHDAFEAGKREICLGSIGGKDCHDCDNRKVCADLLATNLFISTLISQATGKWSDYCNANNSKNES